MLNKLISNILPYLPQKLVWQFSKEYIAGETIEDALQGAGRLNEQNILTTLDVLGEFIKNLDEAEANKNEYLEVIEAAEKAQIRGNYSLKPTFFGLLLDKEIAYSHIREVVKKAAAYNNFVRLDMEDSPCTDMTLDMFRRLKQEFPANVGIVLQAYLKRTHQDIASLKDLQKDGIPVNIRLCKGIYVEPPEIAYKDYHEINTHFLQDIELMIKEGMYPAIATHDKPVVEGTYRLLEKYNYPKENYEFQMLYGVTPALRQSIIDAGHRMRVYVPFGEHWFGYSTRRLKENPAMASVVMKAVFFKG